MLRAWIDDPDQPFPVPLAGLGDAFPPSAYGRPSRYHPAHQTYRTYGEIADLAQRRRARVGQTCGANLP